MSKSNFEEAFKKKHRKIPRENSKLVAVRLPLSLYHKLKKLSKDTNNSLTNVMIEALRFSFGEETDKT